MKKTHALSKKTAVSAVLVLALVSGLSSCSSDPTPTASQESSDLAVSLPSSPSPSFSRVETTTTLPVPTTTTPATLATSPTTAPPAPSTTVKKPTSTTAPKSTTTAPKSTTTLAPVGGGLTAAQVIDALRVPLANALYEFVVYGNEPKLNTKVVSFESQYAAYNLDIVYTNKKSPRLSVLSQTYCFSLDVTGDTLYDVPC